MTTDYVPVDCGLHSEYELAVMQHRKLHLCWRDDGQTVQSGTVTPLDLYTADGEEYIIVRDAQGSQKHIRLDRITACKTLRDNQHRS